MLSLANEGKCKCLIAGNAQGFGVAFAERLMKMGHEVVIVGRLEKSLNKAQKERNDLIIHPANLGNEKERLQVVERALSEHSDINIVFNNSDVDCKPFPLMQVNKGDWNAMLDEVDSGLLASVHMSKLVLPHLLKKDRATIINVSSLLSSTNYAPIAAHCAANAGLHAFTKCLRHQLRDTSVQVVEILAPLFDVDVTPSPLKGTSLLDVFADHTIKQLLVGATEIGHDIDRIMQGEGGRVETTDVEWNHKRGEDELFAKVDKSGIKSNVPTPVFEYKRSSLG